jgi:DNA processing protein
MTRELLARSMELQRRLSRAQLMDLVTSFGRDPEPAAERFLEEHARRMPRDLRDMAGFLADAGAGVVFAFELRYPARIRQLLGNAAPPLLYHIGDLRWLEMPSVAIVGTRRASAAGAESAAAYAKECVARGAAVISGNAPGIDAAAHQAALDAGGCTIVCPPAPLDRYEPAFACSGARDRVLVLSFFLPGSPLLPWNFLARNELVAAHAGATLVAETGMRGGTHNTIGHVRRFGRPLFCVLLPARARHARAHDLLIGSGATPVPPTPTKAAVDAVITGTSRPLAARTSHPDLFE